MTGSIGPAEDALRSTVEAGVAAARRRIAAAGGDLEKVAILAVTKGFGVEAVRAALAAGLAHVGENYGGELLDKAAQLRDDERPAWHYIGNVQRRKVRALAPLVSVWESVARLVEGEEIARRAPGATVLVEVEATGLPGRQGVAAPDAPALVAALQGLDLSVRGLMTVAAPGGGDAARHAFRLVARLADDLGLPERSMGMSGDLEEAVAEGSTTVRLGTALFGPRPAARGLTQ